MANETFQIEGTVLEKYVGNDPFVEIPAGITAIGNGAFYEFDGFCV